MTARAEGQGRAEQLATAILVMMTSTYTYEQLTNTLTHALAEARREEREAAAQRVQRLTGKDSGNWNRAIVYAVEAIREAQP